MGGKVDIFFEYVTAEYIRIRFPGSRLASSQESVTQEQRENDLRKQAAFAQMPRNGWQKDCPLQLNDVVYHGRLKQAGKDENPIAYTQYSARRSPAQKTSCQ